MTCTETHTNKYIHICKTIDLAEFAAHGSKDIERSCVERIARLERETVWCISRKPLSLQWICRSKSRLVQVRVFALCPPVFQSLMIFGFQVLHVQAFFKAFVVLIREITSSDTSCSLNSRIEMILFNDLLLSPELLDLFIGYAVSIDLSWSISLRWRKKRWRRRQHQWLYRLIHNLFLHIHTTTSPFTS